jgi:alcohol dehydrogenase
VAVIADRGRKARVGLRAPFVAPDLALVDPRLTVSAPPSVTAQSGLDALTHAVESFINRASWYATQALAGDAARLIFWNLERALRDGSDMEARSALMAGSLLAAMAFANNRLALAHALSGPLCGYLDVPHGLANAILLPPTLRFVLPEAVDRLSALGQRLGVVSGVSRASAEETVRCIESLAIKAGIPKSFAELGLAYDEDVALKICSEALRSPNVGLAPRAASLEDLLRIYRYAFGGSAGGEVCAF